MFWIPVGLLALISITRWTPYEKPKDWMPPDGTPEQRRTPEGAAYYRKAMRFWFALWVGVLVWFAVIRIVF